MAGGVPRVLDVVLFDVAHISAGQFGINPWWAALIIVCLVALVIQHHLVAGFEASELRRRGRRAVALIAAAALSAAVLPVGGAQDAQGLLPDLVSDPPRPSFFNLLNTADGSTRLVVTFDGYVHNVGEGALDVTGNPQEPGGMKQRVRNGDEWEEVGSPTVRFETDDGHNHFHLIEAIDYVLWNEQLGEQTALGSKIGFCLVDSEQVEPWTEQGYTEDGNKFCEEDNPEATELRMGISPGWRDVYDATTTLQWVDVSAVEPGRYWIGALTDPNDEIVESNESNNDLVFSERTISVPGYAPRPQPPVAVSEPNTSITLQTTQHGTVGTAIFSIVDGPSNGQLDVPLDTDLGSAIVRYTPDPGFTGADQFTYSVRDATSPFPTTVPTATVQLDIATDVGQADAASTAQPSLSAPSTFFETAVGEFSTVQIETVASNGEPARFYARGLPAGLVADPGGSIDGVAAAEGIYDVQLIAIGPGPQDRSTLDVTWIVNPSESNGLLDIATPSSPLGELTRFRVGNNTLGQRFEAQGLPPGLTLEPGAPVVSGTPTAIGDYDVVLQQFAGSDIDGTDVVAESRFVWAVRPTATIDFVL